MQDFANKNGLFAVLDIGTSGTRCLIAKVGENGEPTIAGHGIALSKGVKNMTIVNLADAGKSIGKATDDAEGEAEAGIEKILCNAVVEQTQSVIVNVKIPLKTGAVTQADLSAVRDAALEKIDFKDKQALHCFPVEYVLDDKAFHGDDFEPEGLNGDTFGMAVHVILCEKNPLRTLHKAIDQAHLDCAGMVSSPYAAGLACLTPDEAERGCCVVDLGAGSTGIAVFKGSQLIYETSLPVNSSHITNDIAAWLHVSKKDAEIIKCKYGAAQASDAFDLQEIDYKPFGDEYMISHTRKELCDAVIRPRVEEIFRYVAKALKKSGFDKACGDFVLTGGGSQLQSILNVAAKELSPNVRLGVPLNVHDPKRFVEKAAYPLFTGCFGLLRYIFKERMYATSHKSDNTVKRNSVSKIFHWFLENC